ncbi:THAP domain-containing protein 1-like [Saccostrea echinata]|uniref:THAP domain-containing protein 1-like n=1 Tax=Saccostrea echinata TaxID=191078 RepID=UPI002A7F4BA1|nr:THAP domain-containing protein 1-like [Saccostrea echinata]
MFEDTSTTVRGRRCVAAGCSMTKTETNGISLHYFPFDRPQILRQWTSIVQRNRKKWSGPTEHSVLCSLHFSEDSYPPKFRLMATMGIPCKQKELERDVVPPRNPQLTINLPEKQPIVLDSEELLPN